MKYCWHKTRKYRKGQMTLFIIIGLAVIILGGIFFYFIQKSGSENVVDELSYPNEIQEKIEAIEDCIEDKIEDELLSVGTNGGNPSSEERYTVLEYYGLLETDYVYTFIDGGSTLIEIEEIEEYLVEEIDAFSCYAEQGVIAFPSVEVEVGEEVNVRVTATATVSDGNTTYTLSPENEFIYEINLGGIHNLSEQIISNPQLIDYDLLLESEFNIEVIHPEEFTIIYVIEDEEATLQDESYKFMFAVEAS